MKSTVECINGSITALLNPELSVFLRLDAGESLHMNTKNFLEENRSSPTKTTGILEAMTAEVKNKGRSTLISGKIDLISAQRYALHAERFSNDGDHDAKHGSEIGELGGDNPHFYIVASKNITIETLSWMDAIKKKFGFLEEEQERDR